MSKDCSCCKEQILIISFFQPRTGSSSLRTCYFPIRWGPISTTILHRLKNFFHFTVIQLNKLIFYEFFWNLWRLRYFLYKQIIETVSFLECSFSEQDLYPYRTYTDSKHLLHYYRYLFTTLKKLIYQLEGTSFKDHDEKCLKILSENKLCLGKSTVNTFNSY